MLSAVVFGHDQQISCYQRDQRIRSCCYSCMGLLAPEENTALNTRIAELAEAKLVEATKSQRKMTRYDRIHEIAAEVNRSTQYSATKK